MSLKEGIVVFKGILEEYPPEVFKKAGMHSISNKFFYDAKNIVGTFTDLLHDVYLVELVAYSEVSYRSIKENEAVELVNTKVFEIAEALKEIATLKGLCESVNFEVVDKTLENINGIKQTTNEEKNYG